MTEKKISRCRLANVVACGAEKQVPPPLPCNSIKRGKKFAVMANRGYTDGAPLVDRLGDASSASI